MSELSVGALADGLAHRARQVATALTTPLLPDDYLSKLNPLWSARELRGRVVRLQMETDDTATLEIRAGWGWRPHRAGQYVGIGLQVDGRWHWRSYSLTSPAGDDDLITVTVTADAGGFVSPRLVRDVTPGTVVRLAEPRGEFVLPAVLPERLLFLTAGSGISPVMSMLRTLHERADVPDTVLVHSARSADDVIFGAELRELADEHPTLRLVERHTGTDGRLAVADVPGLVPDWRDRQVWACGPTEMLDDVEAFWGDAGLDEQLNLERFATALADVGAAGGPVTFTAAGREVEVEGTQTILEAGENAGVRLPFGCRMGICHTCMVPIVAGVVRDLRDGTEHHEGELVQTCVSTAAGPCTLEA